MTPLPSSPPFSGQSSSAAAAENNPAIEEKTEIFYGTDNAVNTILQVLSRTAEIVNVCGDPASPSVNLSVDSIRKYWSSLHERGIKIRYIIEMTKENISFCKEIMKFCDIRHIDGIRANFVIVDNREYISSAVSTKSKSVSQMIYSNAQSIVEPQRYIFEILWQKATPGKMAIQEIEAGLLPARTFLLKEPHLILEETKRMVVQSSEYSVCSVFDGLHYTRNYAFEVFANILEKFRQGQHAGIRWITTIEKSGNENFSNMKENAKNSSGSNSSSINNNNMESLELVKLFLRLGMKIRHVKTLPPMSFGVSDKEIGITVERLEGGTLNYNALFSNESFYLEHFKSVFEELWKSGIDASDRITEIERGIEPANIVIIENPKRSIQLAWDIVKEAHSEILVAFSTPNTFRRQMKMGVLRLLESVSRNDVAVRILIPSDDTIEETINQASSICPKVDFKVLDKNMHTKITIVVVDRKKSMIFELRDDHKDDSFEAAGLALYSDSTPIALSYATIMKNLWVEAELYSHITQVNRQLELAKEKLESNNKLQKEFINIAAHDLRTPVQPLLGLAEIWESEFEDQNVERIELRKHDIDVILRNAKRLERLTSYILDVSRIEANSLKLNKQTFDLNEKIRNVIADEKSILSKGKSIDIIFNQTEELPLLVEADASRILEVLSNLIENAAKFTDKMGGTITVTSERKDRQVIVSIKDVGKGIDKEIMPRLFSKFASKSERGTGLGLYLSKAIVEAHGGKIWGENNPDGRGATFTFVLPVFE